MMKHLKYCLVCSNGAEGEMLSSEKPSQELQLHFTPDLAPASFHIQSLLADYHAPSGLLLEVPQTCQTISYLPACVQLLSLPRKPSPKLLCSHIISAGVSFMFQSQTSQVQIPASSPTSCVAVDKLLNFSRPQVTVR